MSAGARGSCPLLIFLGASESAPLTLMGEEARAVVGLAYLPKVGWPKQLLVKERVKNDRIW